MSSSCAGRDFGPVSRVSLLGFQATLSLRGPTRVGGRGVALRRGADGGRSVPGTVARVSPLGFQATLSPRGPTGGGGRGVALRRGVDVGRSVSGTGGAARKISRAVSSTRVSAAGTVQTARHSGQRILRPASDS